MNDRAINLAERQAWSLILIADGVEAAAGLTAGDEDHLVATARKIRSLGRTTLELVQAVRAERSARKAMQTERDRLRTMRTERSA